MPSSANVGGKRYIEPGWFMEGPEGVALIGSRCEACGRVSFPKKRVCPNCYEGELKEIPLSRRGRLHSYALSVMGPADMEKPYVMGLVDLPEGIRLYSMLTNCEPWEKVLRIDMEMEMVMGKIKEDSLGNEVISYKFQPVGEGVER
jgi:uncharacterized OB-fold protein